MKCREYMMKNNENLGWCKPMFSDDGKYAIALAEGKPSAMLFDGEEVDNPSGMMERFAKAVNSDYSDYSGWSDLHIALDALHEGNCCDCPWFDFCDAMDEEVWG